AEDLADPCVEQVEADQRRQVSQGAFEHGDCSAVVDVLSAVLGPVFIEEGERGELGVPVELPAIRTEQDGLVEIQVLSRALPVAETIEGEERKIPGGVMGGEESPDLLIGL